MKLRRLLVLTPLALIVAISAAFAQPEGPAASPKQTLTQVVGTSDVTVVYSRPGVKGRSVFGDLVPYGEVWRTGANAATQLTLATDAKIGGLDVPAGTYGLYTIPGATEWTVILYKDASLWGSYDYDKSGEFGRFTVKPTALEDPVETFTIGFSAFDGYEAMMHLDWENTRVAFPISTK